MKSIHCSGAWRRRHTESVAQTKVVKMSVVLAHDYYILFLQQSLCPLANCPSRLLSTPLFLFCVASCSAMASRCAITERLNLFPAHCNATLVMLWCAACIGTFTDNLVILILIVAHRYRISSSMCSRCDDAAGRRLLYRIHVIPSRLLLDIPSSLTNCRDASTGCCRAELAPIAGCYQRQKVLLSMWQVVRWSIFRKSRLAAI